MENEAVILNKYEIIERCIKRIDEEILQDIIENHINDLLEFAREMLNLKR